MSTATTSGMQDGQVRGSEWSGWAIEAQSLYRFFRAGEEETLALQGVSLAVSAGEFVVVVGPSGSGKSTLFSCLAGLDEPDGGTVWVAGQRISHQPEPDRARARAERVGVLLQSGNLLEHLTLEANLVVAQKLARSQKPAVSRKPGDQVGARRSARVDRARMLDAVGLSGRAKAYPSELSGGEGARAGLAVALINDPDVLLADEPTGELDSHTEASVLELLDAVAERGVAVLTASHSAAVAAAADRIIRLADGRVVG